MADFLMRLADTPLPKQLLSPDMQNLSIKIRLSLAFSSDLGIFYVMFVNDNERSKNSPKLIEAA